MYQIIENAGKENEKCVNEFATLGEAIGHIQRSYTLNEIHNLGVDILQNQTKENQNE